MTPDDTPEAGEHWQPPEHETAATPPEELDSIRYCPGVHKTPQGPPGGPLRPLLQVQSLRALLPEGDDDPEGQLVHVLEDVAPEVVEYLPLGQRVQDAEPVDGNTLRALT